MRIYFHQKLTFFVFLVSLISFSHATKAQRYGTALGLRVGNSDLSRTVGLTFGATNSKAYFSRIDSSVRLLEKHHFFLLWQNSIGPLFQSGSITIWVQDQPLEMRKAFEKYPETRQIVHSYGNSTFGLDMIAGLELTVANAVISLDYKPNINIAGREEFFRGQVGISARTVFGKEQRNKKKRAKRRQKAKKANSSEKNSFWEKLKIGPAY